VARSSAVGATGPPSSGVFPWNRFSTIHALVAHPASVITTVEPIMNHQLHVAATTYSGSITCAPIVLKLASIGSSPVMNRFALNPADTPQNTAAIPASGERPTDLYSAAASGGSTMYPASSP